MKYGFNILTASSPSLSSEGKNSKYIDNSSGVTIIFPIVGATVSRVFPEIKAKYFSLHPVILRN